MRFGHRPPPALDLAVTPWGILGSGILSGKYNADDKTEGRAKIWGLKDRSLAIAREVRSFAAEVGCTPSQVAIAWLRQQAGVIVPILGARTEKQLEENLGALRVCLEPSHLERLHAVTAIELGFPHEFLASEQIRQIVMGGTHDRIVNHHR